MGKSLNCQEGKSMNPHLGITFLFSQQLTSLGPKASQIFFGKKLKFHGVVWTKK